MPPACNGIPIIVIHRVITRYDHERLGADDVLTVVRAIKLVRAVATIHEAVALLGGQNTERGGKDGLKLMHLSKTCYKHEP